MIEFDTKNGRCHIAGTVIEVTSELVSLVHCAYESIEKNIDKETADGFAKLFQNTIHVAFLNNDEISKEAEKKKKEAEIMINKLSDLLNTVKKNLSEEDPETDKAPANDHFDDFNKWLYGEEETDE